MLIAISAQKCEEFYNLLRHQILSENDQELDYALLFTQLIAQATLMNNAIGQEN